MTAEKVRGRAVAQTRKENKDLQTGTKHLVKVEESAVRHFPSVLKRGLVQSFIHMQILVHLH